MPDAKRLAEMMEPGKLRGLASTLDLDIIDWYGMSASDRDSLQCAAAVLREVAGRGEKSARCGVDGCASEAQTAPLCGKHIKDFMPNMRLRADGAPILSQDKVIEIDLERCLACDFHGSEQQNGPTCALVKGLLDPMPWRAGQPAPPDCPLRSGRVIVQAKVAAEKRKG